MKRLGGPRARLGAWPSLGALVLAASAATAATASVVARTPFLASTLFAGLPCAADAGACLSYQGSFGLVSDGRGTLTATALDDVEGESKPPKHEDVLELVLGETIGFYFLGRWSAPEGGPPALSYPSVFAFAAGTDLDGLSPPASGTPEVPIGRIVPGLSEPLELTGQLVGFDARGVATPVGRWTVRLERGAIPEPGTVLLLLATVAAAAAARSRTEASRRSTDRLAGRRPHRRGPGG